MTRTRIAPSPTGEDLHIGNLYTAYINYIWAKKNNGQFVVRVEDTDRTRLVEGSEKRILSTLKAFGIVYDEGPDVGGPYAPYRQSDRIDLYKKYAEELVKKGDAYYCFCSKERLDEVRKKQLAEKQIPRYDRHCRTIKDAEERIKNGEKYVVRLKVPDDKQIVVNDLIRGEIKFMSRDVDDQVILKSDGYPTYHLGVVVDDYLMKITHVIRAEEWLPSTPKHILLYEAFGWEKPVFAHVPILRNADRSKLSKRKNPVWASLYLKQGFLPEAVLNYLSLMGWSHPKQVEVFSKEEFIKVFDLKDVKAIGPAFDPVKLEWMNGEYIRKMNDQDLKEKINEFYEKKYPEDLIEKTTPLIKERIKKLSDYLPLCEFFFAAPTTYEVDLKDKRDLLDKVSAALKSVSDWKAAAIGETMMNVAKESGLKTGEFFGLLRVAITGKKISPPLNESMEILGKEECLRRLA